jgi:hypothetical protein
VDSVSFTVSLVSPSPPITSRFIHKDRDTFFNSARESFSQKYVFTEKQTCTFKNKNQRYATIQTKLHEHLIIRFGTFSPSLKKTSTLPITPSLLLPQLHRSFCLRTSIYTNHLMSSNSPPDWFHSLRFHHTRNTYM